MEAAQIHSGCNCVMWRLLYCLSPFLRVIVQAALQARRRYPQANYAFPAAVLVGFLAWALYTPNRTVDEAKPSTQ